jgi:DNA polymerase/3'-5' exonuclease PolX
VAGYFHDPARRRDLTPFRVTGRVQQSVWESLGDYDLVPHLGAVRAPRLVVHGRQDPIPLASSEAAAAAIPARSSPCSSAAGTCRTSSSPRRCSRGAPAPRPGHAGHGRRVARPVPPGILPPMDPRTAAAALTRIAELLELRGDNPFKTRAYHNAARALLALDADDLGPPLHGGALEAVPGLGPGTLAVVRDLVETGESALLAELAAETPPGLAELLRVPGLGTAKIRQVHDALGVASLDDLAAAAGDGRLAALKGFGAKTADKVARGVAFVRAAGDRRLWPRALADAARLVADVRAHPGVARAEAAGSLRRRVEVVGDVDVVAAVGAPPAAVCDAFARAPGAAGAEPSGARSAESAGVRVRFADGVRLDLYCVAPPRFAVAFWRATGSEAHVAQVAERLAARGYALDGDLVRDAAGAVVPVGDEADLYGLAGLAFVVPELREGMGEVALAARGALPELVEPATCAAPSTATPPTRTARRACSRWPRRRARAGGRTWASPTTRRRRRTRAASRRRACASSTARSTA